MKAVIKFTNGFGETEYWGEYGKYVKYLMDARLFDYEDDAFHQIHSIKRLNATTAPPIWKTAVVQPVKIVEV